MSLQLLLKTGGQAKVDIAEALLAQEKSGHLSAAECAALQSVHAKETGPAPSFMLPAIIQNPSLQYNGKDTKNFLVVIPESDTQWNAMFTKVLGCELETVYAGKKKTFTLPFYMGGVKVKVPKTGVVPPSGSIVTLVVIPRAYVFGESSGLFLECQAVLQ